MINNEEFTERLKIIMQYYNLSGASFAERINVQRSSISHLLSGRNKPSLDFVLKVVKEFKEVELYWLLIGKGNFPRDIEDDKGQVIEKENQLAPILSAENNPEKIETLTKVDHSKSIERIVIFYSDGTFKEYIK